MPVLRRQSNGAARRGATQEGPARGGGPYKGKSEDGDLKTPLQNGKKRNAESGIKNSSKILLTECGGHTILPLRQSLPSLKNVPAFLPLSARRKNSQQGVPVSAQLEKEMSSLEMDREVIRCKTCGLVQYRTRTGNCRRCVRALPQRLEFLIPPPAPPEEAVAEPAA